MPAVEADRAQQIMANLGTGIARIEIIERGYELLNRFGDLAVDLGQYEAETPARFAEGPRAFRRFQAARHIEDFLTQRIADDDPLKTHRIFEGLGEDDDLEQARTRRTEQEYQRWFDVHGLEAQGLAVVLTRPPENQDNSPHASVRIGQGYKYTYGFLGEAATVRGVIVATSIAPRAGQLVLRDVELEGELDRSQTQNFTDLQSGPNTRQTQVLPIITKPYDRRVQPRKLMPTVVMREAA